MMKQLKAVPLYFVVTFLLLYISALSIRFAAAQDKVTSEATTNNKRFYNVSTEEAPNKVYGLFLCNTVYTNQICESCITLAQGEIQRRCPSSVDAIVWYTECMLRYANHPIFSINDDSVFTQSESRPVKFNEYNQQLTDTFISLMSQATTGNSSLMSATTVVYLTTEISLSCYVDCTPDLNPSDCTRCLRTALGRFQTGGYQSGVLLQPSCRLMYVFTDAGSPTPGKGLYIALSAVSIVAAASLFLNIFVCLKSKKATRKPTGNLHMFPGRTRRLKPSRYNI